MNKIQKDLSINEGNYLLKLARQTIASHLGLAAEQVQNPDYPVLNNECGTFVTLKSRGQLRGCIGNIEPAGTIHDSIIRNALNAAFQDTRFAPLTTREMEDIHIDISILTQPTPLKYQDGDDLISKLRPLIDGVTLRLGPYGATFLPQVWEQLPRAEQFLSHLCSKAGLGPNAWQEDHPAVEVYQVQCFEEPEL